ncbi:MAG: hypothetical protein AVDCRST_MAG95-3408 [uncultured Adhaeribacter sp.]|uniref:Uncharacterized protein n=1 Tax=uncultured Adhaeribacter sp. TaxID=448109 RepID=A0A6J4JML5_9BACT|nr:MAG: hypothetical protein AVDCRST_MAG95-3408 [uncultured Adhaeribacter sp.]
MSLRLIEQPADSPDQSKSKCYIVEGYILQQNKLTESNCSD